MASVYLNFVPPNDVRDLVKLHIYEAPAQAGPFSSIEVVTSIGSPGAYITDYTTTQALSATDWFAIQWENSKGAFSDMSSAIQGGTTSVVSEVVERVLLRDPTLNEQIVAQEAAAVVEGYCGTVTPDMSTLNYNELSGLTLLTMARCYLVRVASGSGTSASWTAGLLTEKQSTTTATQTLKSIEDLIRVANTWLGRTYTVVALMKEVSVAGGYTSRLTGVDISRSLIELGTGPIPPSWPTVEIPTNGDGGTMSTGEQIPAGGSTGDVLRRSGVQQLAWTPPPVLEDAEFQFSSQTTAAAPGNGRFRMNNSDISLVTQIYISNLSSNNVDITALLARMIAGNAIRPQDKNDATRYIRYRLSGVAINNTGWFTLPVVYREGTGNFANNAACLLTFLFDTLMGQ